MRQLSVCAQPGKAFFSIGESRASRYSHLKESSGIKLCFTAVAMVRSVALANEGDY
jgi:hypothetical protein